MIYFLGMGLLDRLRDAFSNVAPAAGAFGKGFDSAVGIDIGKSSIKVVQLRKEKGAAVLETYGEIALGPYGDLEIGQATNLGAEKIAEALSDLMKESNVTTKNCALSIPFSSSLISLISLPRKNKKELEKMIPIEARKYIPVPISEVKLDWFMLPEAEAKYVSDENGDIDERNEKAKVLLVAIHNEVLEKYREVLQNTELEPTFSEIEIFSAVRAVIEKGSSPMVVLDIGAATSKLYMVEYGIVKASHNITRGAQDISLALSKSWNTSFKKAEEMKRIHGLSGGAEGSEEAQVAQTAQLSMDYIFTETRRMILSYQKKYNVSIEKLVLIGGGAAIKNLDPLAKSYFDIEVEQGDPFGKVQSPAFLDDVLRDAGPTFSVATGLALRKLQEED